MSYSLRKELTQPYPKKLLDEFDNLSNREEDYESLILKIKKTILNLKTKRSDSISRTTKSELNKVLKLVEKKYSQKFGKKKKVRKQNEKKIFFLWFFFS